MRVHRETRERVSLQEVSDAILSAWAALGAEEQARYALMEAEQAEEEARKVGRHTAQPYAVSL